MWVAAPQLEQRSYETAYVAGTRPDSGMNFHTTRVLPAASLACIVCPPLSCLVWLRLGRSCFPIWLWASCFLSCFAVLPIGCCEQVRACGWWRRNWSKRTTPRRSSPARAMPTVRSQLLLRFAASAVADFDLTLDLLRNGYCGGVRRPAGCGRVSSHVRCGGRRSGLLWRQPPLHAHHTQTGRHTFGPTRHGSCVVLRLAYSDCGFFVQELNALGATLDPIALNRTGAWCFSASGCVAIFSSPF